MKKDKIVFQATYNDNNMNTSQRKVLQKAIPKAGKVRIIKAGRHESGDEMYIIELLNIPPTDKIS